MFCGIKSYNTCSITVRVLTLSELTQPLSHFPAFIAQAADNTLLQVGPKIRCSGVRSRYCCYRNHTAGSKPV